MSSSLMKLQYGFWMNEIGQKGAKLSLNNEVHFLKDKVGKLRGTQIFESFETFILLPMLCTFSTCISQYLSDSHIQICIDIISIRYKRQGNSRKKGGALWEHLLMVFLATSVCIYVHLFQSMLLCSL